MRKRAAIEAQRLISSPCSWSPRRPDLLLQIVSHDLGWGDQHGRRYESALLGQVGLLRGAGKGWGETAVGSVGV